MGTFREHGPGRRAAVALIMVLIVLTTLALIGGPFAASMMIHDQASRNFAADQAAVLAAEAARNHALARLERTSYPLEYAREAVELESERPGKKGRRRPVRGRGTVLRGPRETSRDRRDPGGLYESRRGISPRDVDGPEELEVRLPAFLQLPEKAPADPAALGDGRRVGFDDPRGVRATARVVDEQGKINLNSAPPGLIAAVFGVGRLERRLERNDTEMLLVDASAFPGDADDSTIDGAVIVVDPRSGEVEAITYREKVRGALRGCFRGAFLSGSPVDVFPEESLVYDLRGWKLAYHRFWSPRYGGFQSTELAEFHSLEEAREIAGWQIASLFVRRLGGGVLDAEVLQESGIDPERLATYGVDPGLFLAESSTPSKDAERDYRQAGRRLKKHLRSSEVKRLRAARGARAVVELAARFEAADREERERLAEEVRASLEVARKQRAKFSRRYLSRALAHLGETYRVAGLETLLAEDVERFRHVFTVSSHVPARWSEAQAILGELSSRGPDYQTRVPRVLEFNGGTTVRIRSRSGSRRAELNMVRSVGGAGEGGIGLELPVRRSYAPYGATVEALQRHPVNVNTTSLEVLCAVFTGVQGRDTRHVVTPAEAREIADRVLAARPVQGHRHLLELLLGAAKEETISRSDAEALLVNAVQPTHYSLRASTTGLCYATTDVYTIESRGALNAPSGRRLAQVRFREVVEVSPGGALTRGLLTQRDFADGLYLRSPFQPGYPERRYQHLVAFPGSRSHLVASRPLLLDMARYDRRVVPQGDLGSLRLAVAETPDNAPFTLGGRVEHFRETYEGRELAPGEPFAVPSGTAGGLELTMVPGGIEFWMRLRTLPAPSPDDDNLVKLLDGGTPGERNRISLLYDPRRPRVFLRLRDSSLEDPSITTGQYLEIEAQRTLELHTWYHLRVLWDGVFGGGAQLFIDGIPAVPEEMDNLSTRLTRGIDAESPVSSIRVEDARRFPSEGVVRIGQELFEYTRSGGNSLQVRPEMVSTWKPDGTGNCAPDVPNPSRLRRGSRGSVPGAHPREARVSLWGYSLEIRRKRWVAGDGGGVQVPDVDPTEMVWGPGGLLLLDDLPAWSFPPDVVYPHIYHYDPRPGVVVGGDLILIPFFRRDSDPACRTRLIDPVTRTYFARSIHQGSRGTPVDAIDYFQSRGVCLVEGLGPFLYEKVAVLDPVFTAPQADDPCRVDPGKHQTQGLRLLGPWAPGGQAGTTIPPIPKETRIVQLSIQAAGDVERSYPSSGILELDGTPPPWSGRAPARIRFDGRTHPDDAVEWIRYRYLDPREELFVGELGLRNKFRGYPVEERACKRQLDHPARTPLRLVMELSQGGAGYGDHVTITTGDPSVFEPRVFRVYKTFERDDGRFFVSLLDPRGKDPGPYQNVYSRAMNPRLVKYPSGGLPEVRGGSLTLFGGTQVAAQNPSQNPSPNPPQNPSANPAAGQGRRNLAGLRQSEDDATGITIDEIRLLHNSTVSPDPTLGPQVRFVLVPLEGGKVEHRDGSGPQGTIAKDDPIDPNRPVEVLVVSVSSERGPPTLFARNTTEGVLRLGDELFYFEDPAAGSSATGSRVLIVGNPSGPVVPRPASLLSLLPGERDPRRRVDGQLTPQIAPASAPRGFEPQGFARIEEGVLSGPHARQNFYEVFFYKGLSGGQFTNCLRGQFQTSIADVDDDTRNVAGYIDNVTQRIRLLGRSLLGTPRQTHHVGDAVTLVPYLAITPITGVLRDEGLPVRDAALFSPAGGYLLIDPGVPQADWEILAHLGPRDQGFLRRPVDEGGKGCLRARFGTPRVGGIGQGQFAYEMPFRHFDRFESGTESESLAYLQKSFRVPGAYWRSIDWRQRPWRSGRDRLCEVVVVARLDGEPDWNQELVDSPRTGDLFFFEKKRTASGREETFRIDAYADELEIRIYFRYRVGAFQRLGGHEMNDDWKETPILDSLTVEYEKDGVILRHEELPE
ncbi:MAG: hypothetical protein O7J95_03125 [Planctomycetota bacterium]|nr:hypothetical protein [Planctomycetota bacterium]